jgi:RNA polymerase sigma-70 factor (ECF subfamily)
VVAVLGVVPHNRDDGDDHRGLLLGDERVLGAVYDAYAEFAYGVALHVTGDDAVAEDITCGVFVELWERPYAYDPGQWSMCAWLVAAAHRRAAAVVGAAAGALSRSRTSATQSGPGPGAESDADAPTGPADDAIAAALAGIAPELREVVELSYFHGLTYRQVAAKLSVGEAVVAKRVRAGLHAWSRHGAVDRDADTGAVRTSSARASSVRRTETEAGP